MKKYNESMAHGLLGQAQTSRKTTCRRRPRRPIEEVLQYDPQNIEAKQFLDALAAKTELDKLVAAGDKAFKAGNWVVAVAKFTEVLKRPGPGRPGPATVLFQSEITHAK